MVIKIYDPIDSYNGGVSAKQVASQIDSMSEQDKEIIVRINSPGGEVDEGFAIFDLLKKSGKNITTIVEGKCYSIATVIYLAGDKRLITPNSRLMIHCPWIQPAGEPMTASDLTTFGQRMQELENKILNFYVENTSVSKDELSDMMKAETYIDAEKSIEMNFANAITEPVKAMAYFKPTNNNTIMDIEKIKAGLTSIVEGVLNKTEKTEPAAEVVKAMEYTDKEGKTFKVAKEAGDIMVGDVAEPDGIYTMETGETVTIADGKITEIVKPEAAETEKEKPVEETEEEKMKAELETLRAELAAIKGAEAKAKAETEAAEKAKAEEQAKKAQASSRFIPNRRDMNTTAKPDPYAAFKKNYDLK